MASKSNIEWTEITWNPVTGCDKVSAGCKNCYAEVMAKRLKSMGVEQYSSGFKLKLAPHQLQTPFLWKKKKLVFVNSMSDLFHEDVPLEYIQKVFFTMNATEHIYQILTKRSKRLLELSPYLNWTPNIWMGVSVENQNFTHRIEDLLKTEAFVKFLSIEPLIGKITEIELNGIDWVIVGGESGRKARPIKKEWVDIIKVKCNSLKIPFFFKQWGKKEFNANPNDPTIDSKHIQHAKGGCQMDGKIFREFPEITCV
ncbi:MAG: phage Gp37/Gp68 family protein [Saprospiraceae bacterium]|nr:phage Gp37/Gp68 family protein [Saprospiraceae bacterium]